MTKLILLMIMVNMYVQTNLSNTNEDKYIVGGEDAKIRDFPFMVVLKTTKANNRVFICGGTYIGELWVLTAAHCLKLNNDYPPKIVEHNAVRMIMGLEKKDQKNFQTSFSVKLFVHPLYGNKKLPSLNDIALIKIKPRYNVTRDVKIAKLLMGAVPSRANVTAIGWGRTKTTDNKTTGTSPNRLQRLDLTVWDTTKCGRATWYKKNVICVGRHGKIPCFGDSGSPLVYKNYVVGVFSYMHGCSGNVGVYVAIYNHMSWINDTIAKDGKVQTSDACNWNVTHVIYFVIMLMFKFIYLSVKRFEML